MPRTRRATAAQEPADANANKRSDRETVITLRLPRDLHERLREEGGERGFASEVRRRLEASFAQGAAGSDPRFGDLLTAIGHAASAAAKMGPLPKRMLEDFYDTDRLGPDISPYMAFTEAVTMLMLAFQPDGYRAATNETLMRLSDQLIGLALGALGDRGLAAFARLSDLDQASMKQSGGAARAVAVEAEKRSREKEIKP